MVKDEMKRQLCIAVSEWVDRVCTDTNVLVRFGSADMKLTLTFEGEEGDQHHYEACVEEVRRIEVSDENPLAQDA